MHVTHDVWPGQVQQVGITGHIARVITQPLPAIVGRGEAEALQHRAPRPVEHHNALVKQLTQPTTCTCRW